MSTTISGADAVLVRYGDISTKSSRVRRMMEDTLVANLEWTLSDAGIDASIERGWSRPVVHPATADSVDQAAEVAARTLGVVSTSPAHRVSTERSDILDAVSSVAETGAIQGRFAVRARRADKSLPYTSMELERDAGSAVFDSVSDPDAIEVDLDEPTVTLHIEARESAAYLYTEIIEGAGGLPVGSQAPCVALISGGIDSPVAAYRIMRRGCPIVPVYVDLGPYSGPDHQARALEAMARLRPMAATTAHAAYVVPGGDFVTDLVDSVDRGRMLVLRRFMFRVADRIADEVDATGIVTGEALGQKSSQTATNLFSTSGVTLRPIHRPLLTLDKHEITQQATALGTYQSATIDAGCPSIAPDEVMTRAAPSTVASLEPDDIDRYVEEAVAGARVLELTQLETYRPEPETPPA